MARPTARVLAVLELLQTGGTHTVADLAERLAVDERTVRRYIEHLRDLDIPVNGTAAGTVATGWLVTTACRRSC